MNKNSNKSVINFFGSRWKKFDQEPIKSELKKFSTVNIENTKPTSVSKLYSENSYFFHYA